MRLKLTLAYDGTGFRGWARAARAADGRGRAPRALDTVFRSWRELAVAGRTDAGVHALANVVERRRRRRPAADARRPRR